MPLQNKIGWVAAGILIAVLGLWLVVPVITAWRADRFVDELCAKDGGIHIYEKVEPPSTWVSGKPPIIPPKHRKKEADQFYYVFSSTDIRGNSNSSDISALTVYRTETALYRVKDEKLLGVAIGYARRGGDPIGPWHPSSYRCPRDATTQNLIANALIAKQR